MVGARQIFSFRPARLPAALLAASTPATSSPSGASLSGDDQGVGCGGGLQSWGRETWERKKLPSPHTGLITPPIATLAWAKKRQQGNVAHPADVSLALRHKPDSNGTCLRRGMRLWLVVGH